MTLTFDQLQQANKDRAVHWRGGGKSPGVESNIIELGGEAGELLEAMMLAVEVAAKTGKVLNESKKYLRHVNGMVGGKDNLDDVADELGDVVICCSLLANKLGLDLAEITARKFNKTSDKHGFPVKL